MRTVYILPILICLLTACAAPPVSPTPIPILTSTEETFTSRDSLTGEWLGGFKKADGSVASLLLNFDESSLMIEPKTKTWGLTIKKQDENHIQFNVTGDASEDFEQIDFTGNLSNGTLTGDLTWDGETSNIVFTPIHSIDSALLENYAGVYRFESGRALSIIQSPSFDANGLQFFHEGMTMTDFENGDLRGLYPFDDFTFAVGALRVVGAPFDGRIQFILDDQGNTQGLMWWDEWNGVTPSSTSGQYAERVPFTFEDITFTSEDGTTLAGRVTLPEATEPLPAFVMLHGSEQGTRDNFSQQLMSHYMLSQGIAILNTDKRGVGESGGVYAESASQANLEKLAADAIAGVEYLAARPEIDASRIGLIGYSQAGWIIPIAASKSDKVSFFVNLSGPVVSTAHESLFSSYANDGDTSTSFDEQEINKRLRELTPGGVDPVPVIVELNQPGLWLWGSVDKSVPTTISAENLQTIIDSGKNNFSYQIFPGADHGLNITPNGLFTEIPYSPGVVFYSMLSDWIDLNVK